MKEKVRVTPQGEVLNVHTEDGMEIPDPTPMAPPIGFVRREPLHERIRALVQHEYNRARSMQEVETPEEADDFVIPGDEGEDPREARFAMLPGHEWEENYEPPSNFKEMRERLVAAGWTPPADRARAPSGGAPDGPKGEEASAAGDAASKSVTQPPRSGSSPL